MAVMLLNTVLFAGYHWTIEIETAIMWHIPSNDIGTKQY